MANGVDQIGVVQPGWQGTGLLRHQASLLVLKDLLCSNRQLMLLPKSPFARAPENTGAGRRTKVWGSPFVFQNQADLQGQFKKDK